MKTFGELVGYAIYCRRSEEGLSQEELADKSGVDASRIGKWERGEVVNPRRALFEPVCQVLGIASEEIDKLKKEAASYRENASNSLENPLQKVAVPGIAVIPFNTMGDNTVNYLSSGISEGITFALSRSPHLQIVPGNATSRDHQGEITIRKNGGNYSVDYILEGSVQVGTNKVRIICQLIDVKTGVQLWAERFDQQSDDPLALQDSVSERIMSSLDFREQGVLRRIETKKSWQKNHVDLEEYDYMLRGHDFHLRWSEQDLKKAVEIYEEGIERFPNSALLRAKIGWALYAQATQGWSKNAGEKLENALMLANEAVANRRAPLIAEYLSHRLLGWLYTLHPRDVDKALEHMETTVALAPGIARARADLGCVQLIAGQIESGLENLDVAEQTDANYPRISLFKAWGNRIRGDYLTALHEIEKYNIETIDKYLLLASCQVRLNRLSEAQETVEKATKVFDTLSIDSYRALLAFVDGLFIDEYLGDLRVAGLPETTESNKNELTSVAS